LVTFRREQALQEEPALRDFFACLIRGVGRGDMGLPAISSAAVELDKLLRDDERATQDLVDLVQAHAELASEVARVAGGPQAPDVSRQLARLGLDRLWQLTLHQILASPAFVLASHQAAVDALRQELVAAGEAAHQRSGTLRGPLYSAALFHGLGRLVLLHAAAASGAPADAVAKLDSAHGASLGMVLLEHWGFDADVALAVGHQDHPDRLPEPGQALAQQVQDCRRAALGR